jgi:transposase-like protein
MTSDDHPGLVKAGCEQLPGSGWQRCRVQYAEPRILPMMGVEPAAA